jgi:hypothetical protein
MVAAARRTATDELADLIVECRDDPVLFNDRFLDGKRFWDAQIRIARSVARYRTTIAYSGNMVGKDFLFARLILWWLCTRPDSLVRVTGPTQQQIGSIVWKEIHRAVAGSNLPYHPHITASVQASPQQVVLGPGWEALGFSTRSVERASGHHAGELLVLVIEGSGIEQEIWDAIESLGYARLAINGNPLRADGVFVDIIRHAERDKADGIPATQAVNAIRIKSTESPHADLDKSPVGLADRTWLNAAARRYGRSSLWYKSHVEAEIPSISADTLIPVAWLDYAFSQKRQLVPPGHPIHDTRRIACDLGEGVGRDASCILVRDDWGVLECDYGSQYGVPEAAAIIAKMAAKWTIPAERITFDMLGIGGLFPNHLVKYGLQNARPYAGSGRPSDRAFANLRTQCAWRLRNRLDPSHVPDIREPFRGNLPFTFAAGTYQGRLRTEIEPLTYELVGQHTRLLPKEQWSVILGHSPDVADSLIQSFY